MTGHTGIQWRYVIAPQSIKAGQVIQSGTEAPVAVGNTMPINQVPIGFAIHNIEKHPGKGAQLVRSAGTSAQVMSRGGVEEKKSMQLCNDHVNAC